MQDHVSYCCYASDANIYEECQCQESLANTLFCPVSEQCGGTYDLPEGFEREFDDIVTGNNQVCIYNFTTEASTIEFEIYEELDTDVLLLLYTEEDELFTFPIL